MATTNMTEVNVEGERGERVYEHAESLAAPGDGVSIFIPAGIIKVTCSLVCTAGGQGKIQVTTDLKATVTAGTETWIDWPAGVVAINTSDAFIPVTAVRQVNSAGTTKMTLRAQ